MAERIDPWGSVLIDDYNKIIENYGMEPFDKKILSKLPNPNRLMRRLVVFGHQDLGRIVDAIKKKKDFAILTGIMPSSEKLHLGTKMVIEMVKYFQEQGGKTFVLVADLESLATRDVPLDEAKKRALEFYIPAYIALGLNPKKTVFYFQSKNKKVRDMSVELSPRLTLNEYRALYGEPSAPKIISSLTQISDILFPQFDKVQPVVVPVGSDQSPHLRATRDVVRRYKKVDFIPPSATYHKFTPSLDGSMKMSKSKPNSFISIPEDPEKVAKKIMKAKTGGCDTIEEQKKVGGKPEECVVFELFKQHLIEDDKELDKIFKDCKSGKIMCGGCKKKAADIMKKFMIDFNDKFENAKRNISKLNILEFECE
ncbi:MAG: tryptophan--tRNA ligase [Candidatus Aenigmarchaeota archaeon]|nr:tryptophan--tRNA ligase [Candidatus Aenigmarchaeota archaeon]